MSSITSRRSFAPLLSADTGEAPAEPMGPRSRQVAAANAKARAKRAAKAALEDAEGIDHPAPDDANQDVVEFPAVEEHRRQIQQAKQEGDGIVRDSAESQEEETVPVKTKKPNASKHKLPKREPSGRIVRERTPAEQKARERAEAARAKAKATKPPKAKGEKKLFALDAAVEVLRGARKPMGAKELVEQMAERGLWSSPAGKTPWATLYAAMITEVNKKGKNSRFEKADKGLFRLRKGA